MSDHAVAEMHRLAPGDLLVRCIRADLWAQASYLTVGSSTWLVLIPFTNVENRINGFFFIDHAAVRTAPRWWQYMTKFNVDEP